MKILIRWCRHKICTGCLSGAREITGMEIFVYFLICSYLYWKVFAPSKFFCLEQNLSFQVTPPEMAFTPPQPICSKLLMLSVNKITISKYCMQKYCLFCNNNNNKKTIIIRSFLVHTLLFFFSKTNTGKRLHSICLRMKT